MILWLFAFWVLALALAVGGVIVVEIREWLHNRAIDRRLYVSYRTLQQLQDFDAGLHPGDDGPAGRPSPPAGPDPRQNGKVTFPHESDR